MENIEKNKQHVRRAIEEIWNGGKYDSLEDFISRDFVGHSTSHDQKLEGIQATKQFYVELRNAFPDLHFTITDQVAESDKVVTHWTAEGTHKGNFKGIPATGKRFRITAIDIDRLHNGKVVECWTNMDELGLLHQLGVAPQ